MVRRKKGQMWPETVGDAIAEERTDDYRVAQHHAVLTFCRHLFNSNIVGTDLDDVQVFPVTKRRFEQQPGGGGVHITFSVSWHMVGKADPKCETALRQLLRATPEYPDA